MGFLQKFSCLSFFSFDKDIFDKKEKSRYKIFPKNKAIKTITKTKRQAFALSIFDKTEVENANPPTNVKTIEAKIPKMVMYCVCYLFNSSLNFL